MKSSCRGSMGSREPGSVDSMKETSVFALLLCFLSGLDDKCRVWHPMDGPSHPFLTHYSSILESTNRWAHGQPCSEKVIF